MEFLFLAAGRNDDGFFDKKCSVRQRADIRR